MTNTEMIAEEMPTAVRAVGIARRVKGHHANLEKYRDQMAGIASGIVAEAAMAGRLLIEAKGLMTHGYYLDWVERECLISAGTAAAYSRVAKFWESHPEIQGSESIRAALAICSRIVVGERDGEQPKKIERSSPDLAERASRFVRGISAELVEGLKKEERETMAQALEPVARALWPERFGPLHLPPTPDRESSGG